jgi:hypothetical protein
VLDRDLVAKKPRHFRSGLRDQRLVRVEFQLEVITQELDHALFDLVGFGFGPVNPSKALGHESVGGSGQRRKRGMPSAFHQRG